MTPTTSLVRFVADLSPNLLPQDAFRIGGVGFIDLIGTPIAGRNEDAAASGVPANVLFERLAALQPICARDLTARL